MAGLGFPRSPEAALDCRITLCSLAVWRVSSDSLMHSNQNNPVAAPDRSTPALESLRALRLPARLPELLAPAGDWECARAAVENGADAIYFGLEKFNARMRANNFTEADLPKLRRPSSEWPRTS